MRNNINKKLSDELFQRRENESSHLVYEKELLIYENVKDGNLDAIDESCAAFRGDGAGTLSKDRLRNFKYLFVATITLATRFAIDGGMEPETAYTLSDVYINQVDLLETVDEVFALHREMLTDFTTRMQSLRKSKMLTKPVQQALDYIFSHLHAIITVEELAEYVHLTPTYFSTVFKKEMDISVSDYIRKKRVESAQNLLKYSDFSYQEISNYMAFSSHSHFVSVFKKETGMTPKNYRMRYYRTNWEENNTKK